MINSGQDNLTVAKFSQDFVEENLTTKWLCQVFDLEGIMKQSNFFDKNAGQRDSHQEVHGVEWAIRYGEGYMTNIHLKNFPFATYQQSISVILVCQESEGAFQISPSDLLWDQVVTSNQSSSPKLELQVAQGLLLNSRISTGSSNDPEKIHDFTFDFQELVSSIIHPSILTETYVKSEGNKELDNKVKVIEKEATLDKVPSTPMGEIKAQYVFYSRTMIYIGMYNDGEASKLKEKAKPFLKSWAAEGKDKIFVRQELERMGIRKLSKLNSDAKPIKSSPSNEKKMSDSNEYEQSSTDSKKRLLLEDGETKSSAPTKRRKHDSNKPTQTYVKYNGAEIYLGMHTPTAAADYKKEIDPLLSAWKSQGKPIDFVKEYLEPRAKSRRSNNKQGEYYDGDGTVPNETVSEMMMVSRSPTKRNESGLFVTYKSRIYLGTFHNEEERTKIKDKAMSFINQWKAQGKDQDWVQAELERLNIRHVRKYASKKRTIEYGFDDDDDNDDYASYDSEDGKKKPLLMLEASPANNPDDEHDDAILSSSYKSKGGKKKSKKRTTKKKSNSISVFVHYGTKSSKSLYLGMYKPKEDISKLKKTANKLLRQWEKEDRSYDWAKEELLRLGLRKIKKKSPTKSNHPLAVQDDSDNRSYDDHRVTSQVEKEESEERTGRVNDHDCDSIFSADSSDEEDYSSSEEEREVILVNYNGDSICLGSHSVHFSSIVKKQANELLKGWEAEGKDVSLVKRELESLGLRNV